MEELIDFNHYGIKTTLKRLLADKSAKRNIIWASNTYHHYGSEFEAKRQIEESLFQHGFVLEPRVLKCADTQQDRTRSKAEVFTPSWIVNEMINYCDEEWFGEKGVFNIEKSQSWGPVYQTIEFKEAKDWKDYVDSVRLEITCGEAPYLVSRYDAATGEKIEPTIMRMGILDRKLRVVNENTQDLEEWIHWATRAFQSCYGYEYQGDNLLIARINVLMTFIEYYEERWNQPVPRDILLKIANIISWNLWQMDGLTDTIPFGAPFKASEQVSIFDLIDDNSEPEEEEATACRIYDWRANRSLRFGELKEKTRMKKFDFIIGNPPYQLETGKGQSESNAQVPSKNIFPMFQNSVDKITENVCVLIYPGARWIHRSGRGTKNFGKNQINDPRLSQIIFYPNANDLFSNVEIADGISIVVKNMMKDSKEFQYTYISDEYKGTVKVKSPGTELLPLDPRDISITKKIDEFIKGNKLSYLKDRIFPRSLFGIESSFIENLNEKVLLLDEAEDFNKENQVKLLTNDKAGKAGRARWFVIDKKLIEKNRKYISEWQVIVSSASPGGQKRNNQIAIVDNHSAFGRSRLALGSFKTKEEAENFFRYCNTNIIKYTFLLTNENISSLAKRVPDVLDYKDSNKIIDFKKDIDYQLQKLFNLTKNEMDYIKETVNKERG